MGRMSMSHKRRKHLARFGHVTSRPAHHGPPRDEVKRNVLEAADHLCAWCGRTAELVYPRGGGIKDMKAASQLAAWCGLCDPKPDVLGVGWPSRFADGPPGPCPAGGAPVPQRDVAEVICPHGRCRARWIHAEAPGGRLDRIPEHAHLARPEGR